MLPPSPRREVKRTLFVQLRHHASALARAAWAKETSRRDITRPSVPPWATRGISPIRILGSEVWSIIGARTGRGGQQECTAISRRMEIEDERDSRSPLALAGASDEAPADA
jgi:hypothetical protein